MYWQPLLVSGFICFVTSLLWISKWPAHHCVFFCGLWLVFVFHCCVCVRVLVILLLLLDNKVVFSPLLTDVPFLLICTIQCKNVQHNVLSLWTLVVYLTSYNCLYSTVSSWPLLYVLVYIPICYKNNIWCNVKSGLAHLSRSIFF